MIFSCCDERRRAHVRDHGVVNGFPYNGIDFLEVLDTDAASENERQRKLLVHFLKPIAAGALTKNNMLIEGGERIRGIIVTSVTPGTAANVLTIEVDRRGDFSTYTLRLVQNVRHARSGGGEPPAGFDRILSSVAFSFKVECPTDFDCRPTHICPPETRDEPEIDYLAKDYNSFRQLMLDRMSVLIPQWRERNAADLGIALVEMLAYVGDHLSYQQDVIATEAYLDTARRRTSVRRHALLVDYVMHDGCNARAWVQVWIKADQPYKVMLKQGTKLLTRVDGLPSKPANDSDTTQRITAARPDTFETMYDVTLFTAHNEIEFYTWHDERCCLPAGATSATLKGDLPNLHPGDVLVFEEIAGPLTGHVGDADPAHRHAVRLTRVGSSRDPLFPDPPDGRTPQLLTEIEWHTDDALPFPLCISARTDTSAYNSKVSVARGNIVLSDHGNTLTESLGVVPKAQQVLARAAAGGGPCADRNYFSVPPRFAPELKEQPLTQVAPRRKASLPSSFARDPNASASAEFRWEMRDVLPAIRLEDIDGGLWNPNRDLLSSDAFAGEFVAEVDDDGRATLRFGDDQYGRRPTPEVEFKAIYRIGNGTSGNVGADSLAHILTADSDIERARNPMPARGGTDPESIERVCQNAPSAFRVQDRAVTPQDYVDVAERHREVQQAAATVRWTGSWRTIFLTVDRRGGRPVDDDFEHDLRLHLERYRMAGQDIEIDGPQFVPLEIEMTVCVQPGYFRGDVKAALLLAFSNAIRPDGERGLFHPDNYSFGQPVYLSELYAAAQAIEGVRFVTIEKFQRLGSDSRRALDDGVLKLGRLEIARLDNDPNFAERGVLRITMEGGR
jgi:baseplate J-like protein